MEEFHCRSSRKAPVTKSVTMAKNTNINIIIFIEGKEQYELNGCDFLSV